MRGGRKNRHEREVGNSERSVHAARVCKSGSCSPASLAPSSMPAGAGGRGKRYPAVESEGNNVSVRRCVLRLHHRRIRGVGREIEMKSQPPLL